MSNKNKPDLFFLILITLLSIGGLISTDIFLPSINQMSIDYGISKDHIQSAIAIFLIGLSFCQLIYGPLSDSLGRIPVLLTGLSLWFIGSMGVYFSSSVEQLMFFRLIQGMGACAGLVIARAIIGDTYNKEGCRSFESTEDLFYFNALWDFKEERRTFLC